MRCSDGDGSLSQAEFEAGRPQRPPPSGGPQPAGGPSGPPRAGAADEASSNSNSTSYDPLDTNQDGEVSDMERLAGALADLAKTETGDGGSSDFGSEIARLAQTLYATISGASSNSANAGQLSFAA